LLAPLRRAIFAAPAVRAGWRISRRRSRSSLPSRRRGRPTWWREIGQSCRKSTDNTYTSRNMTGAGGISAWPPPPRRRPKATPSVGSSSFTAIPRSMPSRHTRPRDFAPVTKAAGSTHGLFVHSRHSGEIGDGAGWSSFRANPGSTRFRLPRHRHDAAFSRANCSSSHSGRVRAGAVCRRRASISRSGAGHTPCASRQFPRPLRSSRTGKLRALAVTAANALAGADRRRPPSTSSAIKGQEGRKHVQGVLDAGRPPKPIVDLLPVGNRAHRRSAEVKGQVAGDRARAEQAVAGRVRRIYSTPIRHGKKVIRGREDSAHRRLSGWQILTRMRGQKAQARCRVNAL